MLSYTRPEHPQILNAPSFTDEYARGLRDGLLGYPVQGVSARYLEGYTQGRMKYLGVMCVRGTCSG